MNYTKYLSLLTKENGVPQLSNYQFRRMMNIVHVEGELSSINMIKENYKNTPEFTRFDLIVFKKQKNLTELTGNLKPEDLIKEMMRFSD